MKYRHLAILLFLSAFAFVRAQDDDNQQQKPPTEIPDFSNLDEYIYEPKSTARLSFRHLSAAKAQFFGSGTILAPEGPLPDPTATNVTRTYHDGAVNPDTRTAPATDSGGNPIIDPQTGVAVAEPIPPDGKTNSWNYTDASQVNSALPGFIAFHSYSADIGDVGLRKGAGRSTNGLDLSVTYDMGKLFNGRMNWKLIAGMSVNDINARRADHVTAQINTQTDYYNGFGKNFPAPPYTAPSSTSVALTDSQGNVQTVVEDTSVLISSTPVATTTGSTTDSTSVADTWKIKGAYYTFRAGPVLDIPITHHFHFSFSMGVAMVYAGTSYTVTQTLTPTIGSDIVDVDTNAIYKIRPGAYADASLDYDLTDKAGFFAGAVYQTAEGYTQSLHTTTAQYATKVDLTNQTGFTAGMSIRF